MTRCLTKPGGYISGLRDTLPRARLITPAAIQNGASATPIRQPWAMGLLAAVRWYLAVRARASVFLSRRRTDGGGPFMPYCEK
jgi:hypothetical protein